MLYVRSSLLNRCINIPKLKPHDSGGLGMAGGGDEDEDEDEDVDYGNKLVILTML
jgi:hypothetical protein